MYSDVSISADISSSISLNDLKDNVINKLFNSIIVKKM